MSPAEQMGPVATVILGVATVVLVLILTHLIGRAMNPRRRRE